MAENSVQVEDEKKYVILHYDTWGSYGQHVLDVAVLRDGTVVDPRKLKYPYEKGIEKEVKLPNGVTIIAKQKDSNKNAHKIVKVPKHEVLVVYSIEKNSSKMYPFLEIVSDDVESAEVKVREEVEEKDGGNKKYRFFYDVKYVEVVLKDGKKMEVPIEKIHTKTESELTGKPVVEITAEFRRMNDNGKEVVALVMHAAGDTYYVKENLKKLGFKWSGSSWFRTISGITMDEAEKTLKAVTDGLSNVAEVTVKRWVW